MTAEEYNRAIVSISKEKLATLPAAEFQGKISVIDKDSKIAGAIEALKKAKLIGFDTETRPSFRKGMQYNVALIQLSTEDCSYLFRTNQIGFPRELIEILENPEIKKIGLSTHDDFLNLKKVVEVEPEGFIDLQPFVKDYKIADNSLSRVYGILFGERISKGQRLTNWEQDQLTELQKKYAALDAYACIRIYKYLKGGNFDPKKSEFLRLPPEPELSSEEDEVTNE